MYLGLVLFLQQQLVHGGFRHPVCPVVRRQAKGEILLAQDRLYLGERGNLQIYAIENFRLLYRVLGGTGTESRWKREVAFSWPREIEAANGQVLRPCELKPDRYRVQTSNAKAYVGLELDTVVLTRKNRSQWQVSPSEPIEDRPELHPIRLECKKKGMLGRTSRFYNLPLGVSFEIVQATRHRGTFYSSEVFVPIVHHMAQVLIPWCSKGGAEDEGGKTEYYLQIYDTNLWLTKSSSMLTFNLTTSPTTGFEFRDR